MESIHWFIDRTLTAIVSGTYEDELRFDIYAGTTHISSSDMLYSVVVSGTEGDDYRKNFDKYSDLLDWIDRVVQGEVQVWVS